MNLTYLTKHLCSFFSRELPYRARLSGLVYSQSSKNGEKHEQLGFTLLEVLIAMAILVFISFAIYQATTETYRLRDSLSTEGNFYNGIRLSTSIMQRDISLIYSPIGMSPVYQAQQKALNSNTQNQPGGNGTGGQNQNNGYGQNNLGMQNGAQVVLPDDLSQSYTYWSGALDTSGLRPSRLIGTENKLSFVSASHSRIYKDAPESSFAKIAYDLKPEAKDAQNPGAQILIRTENPNVFGKDDTRDPMMRTYEILHGVKKLTYKYYVRDGNTWKSFRTWDSDKPENLYVFPDIIELTLEVAGGKNQTFEGKFKFRPEIPINALNSKI